MLPVRSLVRIIVLLITVAFARSWSFAQEAPAPESPAAIKAAIAQRKDGIAAADSAMDIAAAIRLRMALAALSKPKEAQELYEAVVYLADSTGRVEDELAARRALAGTLAARGQMKQAYEEALRVADRVGEWSAERSDSLNAGWERALRIADQQRDSLGVAAMASRKAAEQRVTGAEERVEFWMWMAVLSIAVAVLTIALMAWMNSKALRRHREELAALRSDVNVLAERHQNRLRDAGPSISEKPAVADPVAGPPVVEAPAGEVDPIVMGMFRKQAPERLATLREARMRGDHGKVQRVVHTLKPQLVNFDPAFAEICARLADPAAPQGAAWNADLDALEARITRILG